MMNLSADWALSGQPGARGTLVTIFLRGAADGLSLVAPVEDDAYHRARPNLRVRREEGLRLDGQYALHPLLRELLPAWEEGELALVHGAGSEDETRSHFEAQDLMEHGGVTAGGWMGRFLRARSPSQQSALPCVALGRFLPESLAGAPSVAVMSSLEEFSFSTGAPGVSRELQALYARDAGPLGAAARDTFAALQRLEQMRAQRYQPEHGAQYGKDAFAQGLLQIARLIKGEVGLEAASLDLGGWDTHLNQVSLFAQLLPQLARGVAAFQQDLGPARRAQTTVVIMTEFGRRVRENSAFGTDHGRGGVMWVLGGGVRGGQVYGEWRGLTDEMLEGPGDLPVTTNYRQVLAPVMRRHGLDAAGLARVFPDLTGPEVPLYT